jgi:hypothetical protein
MIGRAPLCDASGLSLGEGANPILESSIVKRAD